MIDDSALDGPARHGIARAHLRAALDAYERACSEIARLSAERDLGAGERTGRMANLGAWETERTRLEGVLGAAVGDRARRVDARIDIDALRMLLDED